MYFSLLNLKVKGHNGFLISFGPQSVHQTICTCPNTKTLKDQNGYLYSVFICLGGGISQVKDVHGVGVGWYWCGGGRRPLGRLVELNHVYPTYSLTYFTSLPSPPPSLPLSPSFPPVKGPQGIMGPRTNEGTTEGRGTEAV